jgi:hypothetical protein
VLAVEKAIVKASKDLQKGKRGITAEGLARLVASYCRLRGVPRCGGSLPEDRDMMQDGDPGYYGSLQDEGDERPPSEKPYAPLESAPAL